MKYHYGEAGAWEQPVRRGYKFCCCDCGLVHTMDFRVKDRHVQFRAWRDNRATAMVRRWEAKKRESGAPHDSR